MEIESPSNMNTVIRNTTNDAYEANPDIQDMADNEACWPRDSRVMRYVNNVDQEYEAVPMSSIELGDEVMVVNPLTNTVGHEKIIYLHDHAQEKHPSNDAIMAFKVTVTLEDGSTLSHQLTHNHYMPVYRNVEGVQTHMEVYAKDLEVGDVMLVCGDAAALTKGIISIIEQVSIMDKDCILMWTPSMNIVVDSVASSCRTRGFAPDYHRWLQNPVLAYISMSL